MSWYRPHERGHTRGAPGRPTRPRSASPARGRRRSRPGTGAGRGDQDLPKRAARRGVARDQLRRRRRRAGRYHGTVGVGQVDAAAPDGHPGPAHRRDGAGRRLDVAALSDRELSGLRAVSIGFVFQQFFLAEHATALDNVADALLYAGTGIAERRHQAVRALQRVGLGRKLAARPTQLSGGERQRVAIARAVAGRPAIVLADEPTGNLDSAAGAALLDLLEELNAEGATIIVITHDYAIAARLPRRIAVLDGCIVADTTTPALASPPASQIPPPAAEAEAGEDPVRRRGRPGSPQEQP